MIPKEIAKLVFGPGTVDFGDVSVGSEHVKYFSATNGSDRAIIVRVEFGDASDALRASGPRSQVVAPGETARFAVRLKMDDVAKGSASRWRTSSTTTRRRRTDSTSSRRWSPSRWT